VSLNLEQHFTLALTAWRENRGAGDAGMQSVINVIMNRAAKHGTSPYAECVKPLQFSSMTAKGDLELTLWPREDDVEWGRAQDLAVAACGKALEDITQGATLYYAPRGQEWKKRFTLPSGSEVVFPDSWNLSAVHYVGTIGEQLFFREV
jgi:hypothetical protein